MHAKEVYQFFRENGEGMRARKKINRFIIMLLFSSVSCLGWAQGVDLQSAIKTCVSCHGENGSAPVNPAWPKLAGQNINYFTKEMLDFRLGAKSGRFNPVMQEISAPISNQVLEDLAQYYSNLPATLGAAKPDLVAKGQQLYRGGDLQKGIPACMACHDPQGLGNPPAAFPLLSGQNADYVIAQLEAFHDGSRSNDLNHMMRDIARKMNEQEMQAVASYISGLH